MNALFVPRHHDANTTPSDVAEPDMESAEVITNDEEHAKWLPGVLDLREEIGSKAERQGNLGGLVEVGLEDVPNTGIVLELSTRVCIATKNELVENQEALQHLEILLIGHGATNFVVEISIVQRLYSLQALIRQRWPE